VSIDQRKNFIPVRIALLTVSDTRTLKDDKSGSVLAERIEISGHQVVSRKLIRDDRQKIRSQLESWVKSETVDVIISTGGTGLTGRDVTVEAHRDVYEKEIDAFSVVFSIVSMKKLEPLLFSRAALLALLVERIYLLCLVVLVHARMRGMKSW